MKKKNIKIMLIIIIITAIIFILITPIYSNADFNPADWKPQQTSNFKEKFGGLISTIGTLGSVVSVIALILIGIRFLLGSVEEKAEYKDRFKPYLIGAAFVFAISKITEIIEKIVIEVGKGGTIEGAGNIIITILSQIGAILSVIMLVAIGIKYMGAGVDEKAEYKATLRPYFIGGLVVFAASTLAGVVFDVYNGMNGL